MENKKNKMELIHSIGETYATKSGKTQTRHNFGWQCSSCGKRVWGICIGLLEKCPKCNEELNEFTAIVPDYALEKEILARYDIPVPEAEDIMKHLFDDKPPAYQKSVIRVSPELREHYFTLLYRSL